MNRTYAAANRRGSGITAKLVIGAIALVLIISIIFTARTHAYAGSSDAPRAYTYYTGVEIQKGDTIWDLADRYMVGGELSKREYVNRICEINHVNCDRLVPGQVLIFEYYSNEEL